MKTIIILIVSLLLAPLSMNSQSMKGNEVYSNKISSKVYTTAHGTNLRLSPTPSIVFNDWYQPFEWEASVLIDPSKEYQIYMGIGAALTDAAAETFYKLSEEKQEEFLISYFNKEEGIAYNLARTIIHSCDFSSGSYTYIEEGDSDLNSFTIERDLKYRIPFTKRAIETAGGKLRTYASPWSPPAFMKTNNDMLNGGKLKEEFRQSWANYYVKFIKAYESQGIPIWGLTIQNEPMATQRWESCIYSAEEERDFLKNYLGPTLKKNALGDKKIIIWDHNRDLIYQRASTLLNDTEARKYIWGVGFHWYEDWKDGKPMFQNVQRVKESFPEVNMIFTEGTNEEFSFEEINTPRLAERYGKSMINDFNNGVVAWTDWNILLNEKGGPNHVENYCFAPVIADTRSDELIYTNSYYYIGHFSKFILEGARRISAVSSSNDVLTTAFKNPNGELVIIIMNTSDLTKDYILTLGNKTAKTKLQAHSIQTILLTKL